MDFWEKVKKDLQKEIKAGIAFIKEGAATMKKKTEELTEEGKKQYKIFELKTKVQKEVAELGGKVYDLSSKIKNPMLDKKVKAIVARVKKLEGQIIKLEGKKKETAKKASKKRAT
ncbi:MAG: hypothetical protein A2Z47_15370 [Thermodesulfovibrio sp. RBG_19FT_COMBO_42_12]|nr:MAG: hypothetical protein A2Z47_15370 [Thermodesulfovibrio sp. RBG_19FT_COMBO_42_12]